MFVLSSNSIKANERVPKRHSGEGEDFSPHLSWTNPPAGVREYALICDDPDAPSADPWVHWVIYRIPATASSLPEHIAKSELLDLPKGAMQGRNSWGGIGYRGPMPPPGHGMHHYNFTLYALGGELNLRPDMDKKQLLTAIKGHVIAEARLTGTYER